MRWLAPLVLVACRSNAPQVGADSQAPTPAPSTETAPPSEAQGDPAPDAGGPLLCKGVAVAPQLAALGCALELPDERPAGFSADGKHLGSCVSSCDACPLECRFDGTPSLAFEVGDGPGEPEMDAIIARNLPEAEQEKRIEALHERQRNAFKKKLDALHLLPTAQGSQLAGPFPYPDLALVSKAEHDAKTDVSTLSFGARVGAEEPVYPIRIVLGPHPMRASVAKTSGVHGAELLELQNQFTLEPPQLLWANVTPDGQQLGVVALAGGSSWYEISGSQRQSARAFVGRVYNDTGLRLLPRDPAAAAALFTKAAAVSPDSALFLYNLACAHARAGDPAAQTSLAAAIAKGGASVKARAKTDPDLASVRSAPWFAKLVR